MFNDEQNRCSAGAAQKLYLAARQMVLPQLQNDSEVVKDLRDLWCEQVYKKPYKDLSDKQIYRLIAIMNGVQVKDKDGQKKARDDKTDEPIQHPSASQLAMFKFYAISNALIYCNFQGVSWTDIGTGEILQGEEVKKVLRIMFEKKQPLPRNLITWIFTNYINPKSNQFLIEGKFKKYTNNPSALYYERLSTTELKYLIQRFSQIFKNTNIVNSFNIPNN